MTVWLCVSTFWAPFSRRRQNRTSLAPKVHQFGPIRLQPAPAAPRDRIRAPTGVWIWRQNNYYAIPDEYSTDTSTHSTSLLAPRETCFAFSLDCAVELWVEVMWHVSGAWDKGTRVQRKEKQSFTGLVELLSMYKWVTHYHHQTNSLQETLISETTATLSPSGSTRLLSCSQSL